VIHNDGLTLKGLRAEVAALWRAWLCPGTEERAGR
jgi:hypothetical protein